MTQPSATGVTLHDRHVLAMIALGFTNSRIAQQTGKSVGATRSHVQRLTTKLGADNRAHAVTLGVARGHIVVSTDGRVKPRA